MKIPKAKKLIFISDPMPYQSRKSDVTAVRGKNLTESMMYWKLPLLTGNKPMRKPTGMPQRMALIYPPKLRAIERVVFFSSSLSRYKSPKAVRTLEGCGKANAGIIGLVPEDNNTQTSKIIPTPARIRMLRNFEGTVPLKSNIHEKLFFKLVINYLQLVQNLFFCFLPYILV